MDAQTYKTIVFKINDNNYELTNDFRQLLLSLFNKLNNKEAAIKTIKIIISAKFNIKKSIYKNDKLINAIMVEVFGKDVINN